MIPKVVKINPMIIEKKWGSIEGPSIIGSVKKAKMMPERADMTFE